MMSKSFVLLVVAALGQLSVLSAQQMRREDTHTVGVEVGAHGTQKKLGNAHSAATAAKNAHSAAVASASEKYLAEKKQEDKAHKAWVDKQAKKEVEETEARVEHVLNLHTSGELAIEAKEAARRQEDKAHKAWVDKQAKKEVEETEARVEHVLNLHTSGELAIEAKEAARREKARKWVAEANPVEPYEGPADPNSLTEISKRRSKKAGVYDGMAAVQSGFWAEDRPKERRVDMTDRKIYTWAQYRLKHPFVHSWNLEEQWKQLPTEKRVKKLGKKAFVKRFR